MATDRITTQSYLDGLLNREVRVLLPGDLILVGTLVGWDETAVFIRKHNVRMPMLLSFAGILWLEPNDEAQLTPSSQPETRY